MTRKRFVKKMMGAGYSRNEANALAARARRYGVSYAARWEREKIVAAGRDIAAGLRAGFSALGRSVDRFAAELRKCVEAAAKVCAVLGVTSFYKLEPADYEPEPADMWPKENPFLRITDVSLVASGGVPLNYGQNCDGLRIHHSFADELAAIGPALTQEQIDATTAKWPGGTAVLVGIDLANGPDVAAQIHVAGGADNAD